jgi:hypothetical protein
MNQSSLECLVKNWRYRHLTDEAKAVTKDQRGTCVVEPSDHRPRAQIVHTR